MHIQFNPEVNLGTLLTALVVAVAAISFLVRRSRDVKYLGEKLDILDHSVNHLSGQVNGQAVEIGKMKTRLDMEKR